MEVKKKASVLDRPQGKKRLGLILDRVQLSASTEAESRLCWASDLIGG